jgi:hypothetical protein
MLNEKLNILITFASIGKIYFTIEQKPGVLKLLPRQSRRHLFPLRDHPENFQSRRHLFPLGTPENFPSRRHLFPLRDHPENFLSRCHLFPLKIFKRKSWVVNS